MLKSEEIKTAEKFIKTILRDVPETRGDDKILLLEVWERQGLHLTKEQKHVFMLCMSAETIRRSRQLVQESGFYRDVAKYQQRQFFAEEMKKNI